MYAVLKTGGKQYRVSTGDTLIIEKIVGNAGETVQFNEVLLIGGETPKIGTPLVSDAGVQATILEQGRGPKTIKFVKRRRKHSSQRKHGHRQQQTVLKITEILASGASKSKIAPAIGGAGFVAQAPEASSSKKSAPEKKAEGPKPAAAKKPQAKAAKDEAKADAKPAAPEKSSGKKPKNLLSEARDGKADDLKKLSGVGPKLETLLNENGIFHYDQIAAWNSEEIAYMDDQLSFKGRIERDDWIAQAKELMKG